MARDAELIDEPTSPRRRLAPAERRTELIDAAVSLILEEGDLDAATLERVAERAGCSRNLVYRYFEHHDGLIEAVARRLGRDLVGQLQELDDDTPPRIWLHDVAALLVRRASTEGVLLTLLFQRERGHLTRQRRQLLVGAIIDRLRAGGVPKARAEILAPILGSAIVGAVGATSMGARPAAVLVEVDRLLEAALGVD